MTGQHPRPENGWHAEQLLALMGTLHAFRRWNPNGRLFQANATKFEKGLARMIQDGSFHRLADVFTAWSYRDLGIMLAKSDPNSVECQKTFATLLAKLHAEGKR